MRGISKELESMKFIAATGYNHIDRVVKCILGIIPTKINTKS